MVDEADRRPDLGLIVERRGAALWLTIDRPPKNLLEPRLMDRLREALLAADRDPEVGVVILAGAGEDFCAGLDVEKMRSRPRGPLEFANSFAALLKVFPTLGVPVIAVIRGDAIAGGYSLACSADVAVAESGARIGTFEASIGIWPMLAQVPALQRLLPRHALENVITGEPFSAERAAEVGAVNGVVAPEELDAAVLDWSERVVRAGATLPRGRRAFYDLLERPWEGAVDEALRQFTAQFEAMS